MSISSFLKRAKGWTWCKLGSGGGEDSWKDYRPLVLLLFSTPVIKCPGFCELAIGLRTIYYIGDTASHPQQERRKRVYPRLPSLTPVFIQVPPENLRVFSSAHPIPTVSLPLPFLHCSGPAGPAPLLSLRWLLPLPAKERDLYHPAPQERGCAKGRPCAPLEAPVECGKAGENQHEEGSCDEMGGGGRKIQSLSQNRKLVEVEGASRKRKWKSPERGMGLLGLRTQAEAATSRPRWC
jgi:hypothetical protein